MKDRLTKDTVTRSPTTSVGLAIYRAVRLSGQIRVSK